MTIDVKKGAEAITVALSGRLDTTSAPELDKMIAEDVDASEHLVFDLNGLEYISSAGLRVLLGAQKKMQKAGSMKLVGVCEGVMEVLEMTGFADILTIE